MYHEQDIEVPRGNIERDTCQELRDAIPTREFKDFTKKLKEVNKEKCF